MTAVMQWLSALENSGFSTWLRESTSIWGYPIVLTLHTLGLGVLVGANWVVDVRVLGFASRIPLSALDKAFPIMWVGFWVNAVSGAMLFAADATTKGTTTLFMGKLGLIAIGVLLVVLLRRAVSGREATIGPQAKMLAAASLAVWVAAIGAGRFMAYV
jgi:hypothetical protein